MEEEIIELWEKGNSIKQIESYIWRHYNYKASKEVTKVLDEYTKENAKYALK